MRLVTSDGKSFGVANGLAACFTQTLVSVDVDNSSSMPTEGGELPPTTSSNSKKAKKETSVPSNSSTAEQGKIHFMGNISRKLVITPNYELGTQRKAVKLSQIKSEGVVSSEEDLIAEEDFPMDIMDV